jgi:hypothetical protein
MSLDKDMSLRVSDEELEPLSAEPASPDPVHTEPEFGSAAWQTSLGNSLLAAAATGGPLTNQSDALALHPGYGNAAVAHTLIQRKAEGDNNGGITAPAQQTPPPAPTDLGTAAPSTVSTRVLIVEDTAETVGPGQMKKSQFLAELRNAVSNAVAQSLAGTPWSEADCPYIQFWFAYYSRQDSQHIERSIRRYSPETAAATSASSFITPIVGRVRRSVALWVTTGEITGVPEGMPLTLPGGPVVGAVGAIAGIAGSASGVVAAVGGVVSGIGNLLFKESDGGAKEVNNPHQVQTQLGAGQSLDGGVRSRMEQAYGENFNGVQVHADPNGAALSADLNARAFTVGPHIAFGAGEYKPGTLIGDALIAHELAHVMQQRGVGEGVAAQRAGGGAYSELEEDADEAAVGAVVSSWSNGRTRVARKALPSLKSSLRLQRCGGKPKPAPIPPPTFETYQDRFNKLWLTAPFNAMPAADAGLDPSLSSRGPRTPKARKIFDKILAEDPAMLTAYNANTGGMRDRIDVYIGPEGLNLINSPRLTALLAAFQAHPKPVLVAGFPAFRTSVQTAAAALDPADKLAVERSNDWQRLINDYVKDDAKRAEIRLIISPPAPVAPVVPVAPGPNPPVGPRGTPAQRATFLANWAPQITFNDGTRQVNWRKGATAHYLSGSQNFEVGAGLPAGQTNPGLVLSIRAQILRGAAVISPAQEAQFPPDANSIGALPMPINAPAVVPAKGDTLTIKLEVIEPSGAGMNVVSTKSEVISVLPEVTYTQAEAEAVATADDTYFHDASAAGLIGKMTAKGGVEANVAGSLNAGRLVLRPLTVRHDSTAFVTAQNAGVPNPNQVGYFVGLTYANSLVLPPNAGGTTLNVPPGIVVNRTTDVKTKAKRSDAEVTLFFVHEATHALDIEPTETSDLRGYKTEFRAYWMDGRYGPPGSGGVDTAYDPNLPPPGPKSPRARKIFDHLYSGSTYAHIKRAYDNNTGGFREVVDNYFIPDGINLIASVRLDSLRAVIEAWGGAGFPAFRTSVQAFVGIGPAPAAGVLNADDRKEISRNRSWRDLVERKVPGGGDQATIKSDLGIP